VSEPTYFGGSADVDENELLAREQLYGVQLSWTVDGELRETDWRDEVAKRTKGQERMLIVLSVATGDKGGKWQHVTTKMLRCTSLDQLGDAGRQERQIAAESGTVIYSACAHVITADDLAWVQGGDA